MAIWIVFFYVIFYNIIEFNHFLHRFIILLHLISSLSLTKSLLVSYANVSIESIDCIPLSSYELRAILLVSSVKTWCLSLLNLYCIFNIDLNKFLYAIYAIYFFLIIYFILKLSCFCTVFMIFKLKFSFYDTLFCAFFSFIFTTVIY